MELLLSTNDLLVIQEQESNDEVFLEQFHNTQAIFFLLFVVAVSVASATVSVGAYRSGPYYPYAAPYQPYQSYGYGPAYRSYPAYSAGYAAGGPVYSAPAYQPYYSYYPSAYPYYKA